MSVFALRRKSGFPKESQVSSQFLMNTLNGISIALTRVESSHECDGSYMRPAISISVRAVGRANLPDEALSF